MSWRKVIAAAIGLGLVVVALHTTRADPASEQASAGKKEASKWAVAVEPKPLSDHVKNGLEFLVKTQHSNGGWAQGEESTNMGHSLDKLKDTPNVADTCVATLALIRAGSTPGKGPHAPHIRKALEFICSEVEESDEKSMLITKAQGIRVQMKLGPYVDTFLAAMLLAEAKDQMPDAESRKRVFAALDKTMDKIEKNQRSDGTWDDRGWAPTLAQGIAAKGLNRAKQAGADVDETVRANAEGYARKQFDETTGAFDGKGSAGVALYAGSASMGAMQDSANTNASLRDGLKLKVVSGATPAEREEAKQTLDRFDKNEKDLEAAQATIVAKLEDERFVKGFGSNGGEEFLSYMNIGESLVVKGGENWTKWDEKITANLNRVQNADGSWTGHHCITGRTFCTAAALLVLTVDRAPVPLSATIKRR